MSTQSALIVLVFSMNASAQVLPVDATWKAYNYNFATLPTSYGAGTATFAFPVGPLPNFGGVKEVGLNFGGKCFYNHGNYIEGPGTASFTLHTFGAQ